MVLWVHAQMTVNGVVSSSTNDCYPVVIWLKGCLKHLKKSVNPVMVNISWIHKYHNTTHYILIWVDRVECNNFQDTVDYSGLMADCLHMMGVKFANELILSENANLKLFSDVPLTVSDRYVHCGTALSSLGNHTIPHNFITIFLTLF